MLGGPPVGEGVTRVRGKVVMQFWRKRYCWVGAYWC